MDQDLGKNPLYKDVEDYLAKPKPKIAMNQSFGRKRLLRTPFFLVSAFFGLIIVIGILGLRQNLQKETATPKPQPEPQPVLMSTVEPKIICKNFGSLEEALNTLNGALNNIDLIVCGLDLSGKGLTRVPSEVSKLVTLNELSLKNNHLTTFPLELLSFNTTQDGKLKTIGPFPNLYSLDLSNNLIVTMSSQIQQKMTQAQQQVGESPISISLQSLKLTGNNISEDERAKLKQLLPNVQITF